MNNQAIYYSIRQSWKNFKERIYRTSPVYRRLKKIAEDINIIKCDIRDYDIKTTIQLRKIVDLINNESAVSDPLSNTLNGIFDLADSDSNLNTRLGQKIITKGQKDIVINLIDNIIKDKKFLILDIGASDGWFFRLLSQYRKINDNAVLAYEPLKIHTPQLDLLKRIYKNFDYYQIGIGDKNGVMSIKESAEIKGLSSFLELDDRYHYFNKNLDQSITQEYEVNVTTLDDQYVNNAAFKEFDNIAIKIDVQGFERNVLIGAKELFKAKKVKAILIELSTVKKYKYSSTYDEIFNLLHDDGFILFDLLPFYREINFEFQASHTGWLTEFDAIFVHREFLNV